MNQSFNFFICYLNINADRDTGKKNDNLFLLAQTFSFSDHFQVFTRLNLFEKGRKIKLSKSKLRTFVFCVWS